MKVWTAWNQQGKQSARQPTTAKIFTRKSADIGLQDIPCKLDEVRAGRLPKKYPGNIVEMVTAAVSLKTLIL